MSKEFFQVTPIEKIHEYIAAFSKADTETVPLMDAAGRIIAETVTSDMDLPGFSRSTMDGYAVRAADTFGASEANPAYFDIRGTIAMGETAEQPVSAGTAVQIATGGMLPPGADGVVMIEHAAEIDAGTLEVYTRIAPGANVIEKDEDLQADRAVLEPGACIRPQEAGLLAAVGRTSVRVYKKPVIGIISTGDELVAADQKPASGQIRDVNTYTLSGLITDAGGVPWPTGIVADRFDELRTAAQNALDACDMVLISGGSSVGTRDLTIDVINALPDSQILVHGIPVRPGKPTILATADGKAFWGLPGHVASAMVVFQVFVKPFIRHIGGRALFLRRPYPVYAILTRNVASAQGRVDYVRIRLIESGEGFQAQPILGPSGLIRPMVEADGLIEIDMNTEGLEKGAQVAVIPF